MKILLIGPCPPPHGGISVHMMRIAQDLRAAGIACELLNTAAVSSWIGFCATLVRYAVRGWTFHLHTNGHNRNSWLIALACGVVGRACILTLHSGIAPAYLAAPSPLRRALAQFACRQYTRIIGVNTAIRDALVSLEVPASRIDVIPAYLGAAYPEAPLDPNVVNWIERHRPLFSTALFFRPEYGFNLLVEALGRLRVSHLSPGCVVMGSGEDRAGAERLIRDAGLEDNILLLGDVSHDVCLAAMAASDVFLRATLEDGDSVSVREALSLGVPVVASRVGARPPEAILFQPGSVDELIAGIESALTNHTPGSPQATNQDREMDRLLSVYARAVSGMDYAAA